MAESAWASGVDIFGYLSAAIGGWFPAINARNRVSDGVPAGKRSAPASNARFADLAQSRRAF